MDLILPRRFLARPRARIDGFFAGELEERSIGIIDRKRPETFPFPFKLVGL